MKLRPHHLLCTRAFKGNGYSNSFTRNMKHTLLKIKAGAIIELVEGFDSVCVCCPERNGTVCKSEEKVSELDRVVLETFNLTLKSYPYTILEAIIQQKLNRQTYEQICGRCAWFKKGICTFEDVNRPVMN